jgi:spore germination protein YaaH|uniref:glycosyl hydrolase family 18 protein n=1 Tax=Candidatus Planktophila sp. TaxID=2175601 RepID=UPI00404A08D7
MKHRYSLRIFLAILLLVIPLAQAEIARADNPPRKILTGWLPYYSMKTYLPAVLANADLIREIMPFWYTLRYDSKTKRPVVVDVYTTANPSVPIATPLVALRNAGMTIIPTITDGTSEMVLANLISKPITRKQVVDAIMTMVASQNYDGVDLDFEGFAFIDSPSTWKATAPNWVLFIKELSVALRAQNKLLSVTTPYVFNPAEKQKGYFVYAWADVAPFIDRLRIMTYDYSTSRPGPIGPIEWVEKTVKYAISIMPASKVYLGLPGYGKDWVTKVEGICPANLSKVITPKAKAGTFLMRDAANIAAIYGAVPIYNEKFAEVTFSYKREYTGQTSSGLSTTCTASRTAWHQNAQSFSERAKLIAKYQLGGAAQWVIGQEEPLAMVAIREVATGIAPAQLESTLSASKTEVSYGNPVTLSGQITLKDKTPVASLAFTVEGTYPDGTVRTLTTGVTAADGTYALPMLIGKSVSLQVLTEPSWERAASATQPIAITVMRNLIIDSPTSVKAGSPLTISGVILPRLADASVTLTLASGKVIGAPVLTDLQGSFTLTIPAQARGISTYQIAVAADTQWPLLKSETFSIIVR